MIVMPLISFAKQGFVIKGKITGIVSGSVGIIDYKAPGTDIFPRVRVLNGEFTFTGKLDYPRLVELKVSTRSVYLFLENTTYTVECDFSTLSSSSFKGGRLNDQWCDYNSSGQSPLEYLQAHPKLELAPWLAAKCINSFQEAARAYALLTAEDRLTPDGKSLLACLERYEKVAPGKMLPDFELKDPEGKAFSIKELKGKIVVMDFWASWCGPCRAYIPTIREHYLRFKDKGVEFVSISLDDNREKWMDAMADEKMEWQQARSEDGFTEGKGLRQLFNITGIPYMLIVNKDGRIAEPLDYYNKEKLPLILERLCSEPLN